MKKMKDERERDQSPITIDIASNWHNLEVLSLECEFTNHFITAYHLPKIWWKKSLFCLSFVVIVTVEQPCWSVELYLCWRWSPLWQFFPFYRNESSRASELENLRAMIQNPVGATPEIHWYYFKVKEDH